MAFYVYIIESELDGTFYKGFTEDPDLRLQRHNNGETVSTRHKRPWKMVHLEEHQTKRDALIREKSLKTWNRQKLLELMKSEKNKLRG